MPELPEVETIVRQLAPFLPGRSIQRVKIVRSDLLREEPESFRQGLVGSTIEKVSRRGKNIVLSFDPAQFLIVNLGMTGRLLLRPRRGATETPTHLALSFALAPGGTLWYDDVRRFGHLLRFSPEDWAMESGRLGPEPLGTDLTSQGFYERLQLSRAPIRSWLLDQTRLAGVGNIYASESLFRSGIHPLRKAGTLSPREAKSLLEGVRAVLREAIEGRGTTLRDYRTASGEPGDFGPRLRVYGKEGEACPACNAPVQRIVFANRSAFLCPQCQPEVSPSEL